jgi:hypothetical protein
MALNPCEKKVHTHQDKVQYLNNKFIMMISKANGELVNCVAIMYFQLVKELVRWDKCQKIWLKKQSEDNQKMMYAILP